MQKAGMRSHLRCFEVWGRRSRA